MEVEKWLEDLRLRGSRLPHDEGMARQDSTEEYDQVRLAKGAQFFRRNYFSLFVSMLTGLLSLMYVETIVRVLHLTGRSHTPALAFTRYLGTLNHAVQWYEGLASLQASLRTVLQLHRAAALRTRRSADDPSISQFDMVVTQWAFIGPVYLFQKQLGIDRVSRDDLDGFNYTMYLVGKHLGIMEEFNMCSGGVERGLACSQAILSQVIQPSLRSEVVLSEVMATKLLDGANILNPFIDQTAFKLRAKRLLLEEDARKEPNLSGLSRFLYLVQVVVLEQLMHSWLAAPIRFFVNKLMELNIFLALDWADNIVQTFQEQRQWTLRARLEAVLNIPVVASISFTRLIVRKAKNITLH